MTVVTDDIILLVHAQWERGLIVPNRICAEVLREQAREAEEAGLVEKSVYHSSSGVADCYSLTRAGIIRVAELTGANVVHFGNDDIVTLK